jgi:hypothetical protein
MAEWIELDPEQLNQNERTCVNGIEINVGLSPYDIPERVRGSYDDDIGRFVIEFEYLDDNEPREISWQNEHVTLCVGENTGCLYAIHVDVESLGADAVKVRVSVADAIRHLSEDERHSAQRRHYEVAEEIIAKNAERLLAGV